MFPISRILYHLVTTNQEFDETKFALADVRQKQRQLATLKRKATLFGFTLLPIEQPT